MFLDVLYSIIRNLFDTYCISLFANANPVCSTTGYDLAYMIHNCLNQTCLFPNPFSMESEENAGSTLEIPEHPQLDTNIPAPPAVLDTVYEDNEPAMLDTVYQDEDNEVYNSLSLS